MGGTKDDDKNKRPTPAAVVAQCVSAARVFLTTIVMTTMNTQSIATNAAALMLEMGYAKLSSGAHTGMEEAEREEGSK